MKTKPSHWGRLLAAAAAVLTLAGCAPLVPSDAGTVRDIYDMKQMLADSTKRQELSDTRITASLTSIENKVDACPNLGPAVDDLARMVKDQQAQIAQMNQQMQAMMVALDTMSRRGGGPGIQYNSGAGAPAPGPGTTPGPAEAAPAAGDEQITMMPGSGAAVQAFNTAAQQFNAGRYDQAREGFRQAIEQNPTTDQRTEIQYWQAVTFQKTGDARAAEEGYQSLMTTNKSHPRAWSALEKLAQLRQQAGDLDTALSYYKAFLDPVTGWPAYPNIQRVRDAIAQIEAQKRGGAAAPNP